MNVLPDSVRFTHVETVQDTFPEPMRSVENDDRVTYSATMANVPR